MNNPLTRPRRNQTGQNHCQKNEKSDWYGTKFIAVWTQMEPLPRTVNAPLAEAEGVAAVPWRGSLDHAALGAHPDHQGMNERCRKENQP